MQGYLYRTPDVPSDYNYVEFTENGYILYNSSTPVIGDTYYQFYTNIGADVHTQSTVVNDVQASSIAYYTTTDDINARSDIYGIYSTVFIFCVFAVFLVNIFTRIVKRNGVFSL